MTDGGTDAVDGLGYGLRGYDEVRCVFHPLLGTVSFSKDDRERGFHGGRVGDSSG